MSTSSANANTSSMPVGIFARTFERPTLDGVLDAIQAHGVQQIQFDMVCAGLPEMPEEIDAATIARVRAAATQRGLVLAGLSGMYNMIHPDLEQRAAGLRQLGVMVAAARPMGAEVVTLCTGTRDPHSMWRRHPANDDPDAWVDLRAAMTAATAIAEAHGVTLAFEPEVANVVDSAQKARRILDEIGSPRLKVVFDGANIFHKGELAHMHAMLTAAIELLGDDIVMAHAKDLDRDGEAGHLAAGHGLLDYKHYLAELKRVGFTGPVLLHGLSEAQVDGCLAFVKANLPLAESGR